MSAMSGSEKFAEYCARHGLKGDTITKLTEAGFENKEDLSLLKTEDIEKLQLLLQQKLKLQDVVEKLHKQDADERVERARADAEKRVERTKADEQQTDDEIRIVLFGKTGCGKSATANTILGPHVQDLFKESDDLNAETKACQRRSIKINGRNIRVIETPGLLDTCRDQNEVANEVTRCLMMSSPGPHILLFVLNIKERFTEQEFLSYDMLRRLFASNLNWYVAVLFTHGDELKKEETMEKLLEQAELAFQRDPNKTKGVKNQLQMLLDDVQNRKILFSNKGEQATKDQQVLKLLRLISVMKENNAPIPFFSDKKTQDDSGYLRDKVDEYMKSNPGVSRGKAWEEVQEQIKTQNESRKTRNLIGVSGLAGAGLGGGAAAFLVPPLVLNPVGAGIAGAAALGAAAAGTAAMVRQREGRCSVM